MLHKKDKPLHQDTNDQIYRIEGMDCSSCAASLEKHMANLPSVQKVQVHFSTGKMKIAHSLPPESIQKEIKKAGYTGQLLTGQKSLPSTSTAKGNVAALLAGLFIACGYILSHTGLSQFTTDIFYGLAIVISGAKPAKSAYYALKSRSLDMNVLMAIAAIGAAILGEWLEGASIVWLFAIGNILQNKSIDKTRSSIRDLMDLTPPQAWLKTARGLVQQSIEAIKVGETIVVKPGERIPLDGTILNGESSVNQAPITGESVPVDKKEGDAVYAGTVNESGALEVKVISSANDTTLSRIIHLVEEAQEKKAKSQAFVDRFAAIYTPIVFLLAIFTMIIPPLLNVGSRNEWLYKGLELLVIACPCALVISTPVAIVSAIGNAAKKGILIKGGTALETAGKLNVVAFDKTGTLTKGKPTVCSVNVLAEVAEKDLLSIARTIEEQSKHPIAKAIIEHAEKRNIIGLKGEAYQAIPGKGATATINGIDYFAGNEKLFAEMNLSLQNVKVLFEEFQQEGHTVVLIGTRTKILGLIAVSDQVRESSAYALKRLKEIGMAEIVMLTGDNEGTAKKIAKEALVNRYFAELLPEDKVAKINQLRKDGTVVGMVGDGINDAPALATADLGIAMGGAGTDTAIETADIVLMADHLEKLPHAIQLSRKAMTIIKQNIWFSLITKLTALALIYPNYLTLWIAVLSDTGAALIVILNSMRLLRFKA
ncbi:heavy metal translocating P-type ATPase [Fictibacillus gelatini]|uniref:heavy metal translocating P-type ATPase n=1 Tax=Fictibacillus gelatini TaxID=225985 RepID=UPI0004108E6E|nr:cation-translocating P-type ATPase [Fictibacillus gelatini]